MKKLFMLSIVLLYLSILTNAQGIYFSEPTSSSVYYVLCRGEVGISYNFYHSNELVVYEYNAALYTPGEGWSNWKIGETGGWWVNKAGTYQIKGQAYVENIFYPGWKYWAERAPFSFQVIDTCAPSTPQNFTVSFAHNQNPVLSWDANPELDLDGYRVYKKYTTSSGTQTTDVFTINTNYTDVNFTALKFNGQDKVEYWIIAEDINNLSSDETQHIIGDGTSSYQWKIDVEKHDGETPHEYDLFQNYPNPFNPSTVITYSILENGYVTLAVFNSLGQLVENLVQQNQSRGEYTVQFNAKTLPNGVYYYRLKAGNFTDVKKMIISK